MKIREMDIYFTVPVDADALKACRIKAGYTSMASFERELKQRGGPTNYTNIERNYTKGSNSIRGDVAELIAKVLGVPVTQVFPQYSTAKSVKEQMVDDRYYKPFETIEERNAAIVATLPVVRGAAYKYSYLLRDKNEKGAYTFDVSDVISTAYVSLVHMADIAMKKGIKKEVSFAAAAYVAVKNDFLRIYKDSQRTSRKAIVIGLEAYTSDDEGEEAVSFAASDCVEDQIVLRDEVCRAIRQLTAEQRRDRLIQSLIAECHLEVAYA